MLEGPSGASMNRNHSSDPGGHCINAQTASLTHHRSPGSASDTGSTLRDFHSKPAIVGVLGTTCYHTCSECTDVHSSVETSSRSGACAVRCQFALQPGLASKRRSVMPSTRLTIYLLRDEVTKPADVLVRGKKPTALELSQDSVAGGVFYYEARPATPPSWVSFLEPLIPVVPQQLLTASASVLLVIRAGERWFAMTFGYGRSLLDLSKVEPRFGLRVALNRIDARRIRSLDTKTFEDMVVTKNTQVSRSSELPAFGVDISRDILRAVTGEPRDEVLAKRLSGADALVVNVEIVSQRLAALCGELLAAYSEDTYMENFGWIDQLSLVNDPVLRQALDEQLVEQLRLGDTSATHMVMPEAIGWEDIDTFRIVGTKDVEYDDLDLDKYLAELGARRAKLTPANIRTRRISVRFSRTNEFDQRWTLHQCLVSEQRLNSRFYALIEGRWFCVSDSLVSEVDSFATSIDPGSLSLIAADRGETESNYSRRLAESDRSRFLLLDAHIKRPGGASSGIEFCDVLASNGELIHIKRKARSATLSHLFAQGIVSATTFLQDGFFRDQIRSVIEKVSDPGSASRWLDLVPDSAGQVDRTRYAVSYVVIANSSRHGNGWLPFFSKLNLMQSGRQLRSMGFRFHLSRVDVLQQQT